MMEVGVVRAGLLGRWGGGPRWRVNGMGPENRDELQMENKNMER